MFRRTLNVPPHGGEGIQDNSGYAFTYHHTNKVIQNNGMYSVSNHIKADTYRRVGGGFAAANPSVCMIFDVICKQIHAIILYYSICVATCECIYANDMYSFAAMGRNI